jgi:hypothetical protein
MCESKIAVFLGVGSFLWTSKEMNEAVGRQAPQAMKKNSLRIAKEFINFTPCIQKTFKKNYKAN